MFKLIVTFLALIVVVPATMTESSTALRFVRAHISIDNKVIFEFKTGDDGLPDADEVWDYLRTKEFRSTELFTQLSKDGKLVERDGNFTFNLGVRIGVDYGGVIEFPAGLRLIKTKSGGYLMNTEDVEFSFLNRLITRESAAQLKKPRANWDERLKLLDK